MAKLFAQVTCMHHRGGKHGGNANESGLSLFDKIPHFADQMSLDELEILMADGQVLTIKGERKECLDEGRKWLQRKQGYGSFRRQIRLPGAVDQQKVEAELVQGVLTITLPKAEEIKPQRIPVKGA